jgi:hypothetical protein
MKHLFLSLTICSTLMAQDAIAKPADIFDPVINQIKDTMPQGWTVRLPSNITFAGGDGKPLGLYPNSVFFSKDSQEFFVSLYTKPDCTARVCAIGSLVSSRDNDQSYAHMLLSRPIFSAADVAKLRKIQQKDYHNWTKADREFIQTGEQAILRRESITLKPGVKGTFVTNRGMGASTPPGVSVVWQQDGFNFRISTGARLDESGRVNQERKTELINAAISMAKESPITSDK